MFCTLHLHESIYIKMSEKIVGYCKVSFQLLFISIIEPKTDVSLTVFPVRKPPKWVN